MLVPRSAIPPNRADGVCRAPIRWRHARPPLDVYLYLSIYLYPPRSLSLPLSLSLTRSLAHSLSLSRSIYLYLYLPIYLHIERETCFIFSYPAAPSHPIERITCAVLPSDGATPVRPSRSQSQRASSLANGRSGSLASAQQRSSAMQARPSSLGLGTGRRAPRGMDGYMYIHICMYTTTTRHL